MKFLKMHGLGNDFVIVDSRIDGRKQSKQVVQAVSDRRTGVGCDQFIVIEPSKKADIFMRIYNPDGSEAESCGNATRCVALVGMEEIKKREITIETLGGVLSCRFETDGRVTVDMGKPKFEWKEIPLSRQADTMNLALANGTVSAVGVNMGNPHAVIFLEGVENLDVQKLGPSLETDPLFPKRTNVEFVEVRNKHEMRMRVWERGAGETRACGSGACAAVAAAVKKGYVARKTRVHLDGGVLDFEWRESDDHMLMTGAATHVFDGILKDL